MQKYFAFALLCLPATIVFFLPPSRQHHHHLNPNPVFAFLLIIFSWALLIIVVLLSSGVQSGGIPDSWLTANGCHGYYYGYWWLCYAYGPQWGRPYNTHYFGGWLGPYHPGTWDW